MQSGILACNIIIWLLYDLTIPKLRLGEFNTIIYI